MAGSSNHSHGRGGRPLIVANCSGAAGDPGYQLYRQATGGPVDVITGDYLAEVNIADNAEAKAAGKHHGYIDTALDGITQTLEVLQEKRIKVIIDGGALNPEGLAQAIISAIKDKGLSLVVAYVSGDDRLPQITEQIEKQGQLPPHLDAENPDVKLDVNARDLLKPNHKVVSANAYLGARGIVKALEAGADIIITGRVADASPVIGAAWWWHGWEATNYDELGGALIAGHLIECSAYLTGSNFSGFDEFPTEQLLDLPFGIVEINEDGSCVATKHENTSGVVNADTCKNQLLYEIQGERYLNSDVNANIHNIAIKDIAPNRVQITGVTGGPPPPTTKLAILYKGGYESQMLFNAAGYGIDHKFALWKTQLTAGLDKLGITQKLDKLEFQRIGDSPYNASSQLRSTVYFRLFTQAEETAPIGGLLKIFREIGMQHYSGMHCSLDFRTAIPRPYLAYWPAVIEQNLLEEEAVILDASGNVSSTIAAGHPPKYEGLGPRASYETAEPVDIASLGSGKKVRLGDIALARSGDKGANVNIGIYVRDPEAYGWLRTYLSRAKMQELVGEDWRSEYTIERVEFPNLSAVHFVIYGLLGRGVTSSVKLDGLGKGFADYIRNREVEVPESLYQRLAPRPIVSV